MVRRIGTLRVLTYKKTHASRGIEIAIISGRSIQNSTGTKFHSWYSVHSLRSYYHISTFVIETLANNCVSVCVSRVIAVTKKNNAV